MALYGHHPAVPIRMRQPEIRKRALKEEIVDVSAENEKLRKDLNSLKSENSKMHMRVAQLHLMIAALHQEIQDRQKDLDTFKTQLRGGEKKNKKS